MTSIAPYIKAFQQFESGLNGSAIGYLHGKRKEALKNFEQAGFPTKRQESWRYTDLSAMLQKEWLPATEAPSLTEEDITPFLPEGMEAHLLVFADGLFQQHLSHWQDEDAFVVISTLEEAIKTHSQLVERHLGRYAGTSGQGLLALNTAFAQRGVFIYVPQGKIVKHPIHLLFLSSASAGQVLSQPRILVVAEARTELSIFEQWQSLGKGQSWSNSVAEVVAGEHSFVNHYRLQAEREGAYHTSWSQYEQAGGSRCTQVSVTTGGDLVRNNLNFHLSGPYAESHLHGLYLPTGSQHIDIQSFVDHAVPNCFSNELYKGIMRHKATGVFNGKILVRQDAQKTNAYQNNRNILLSKEAHINTKPQLEIFADDVKCSHGATIGQLDADAIFYLRARGLSEHDAKVLLTHGFALEVLEHIPLESLCSYIDQFVVRELETV